MSTTDGDTFVPPPDRLAALCPPEVQRLAARMAQDAFGRILRLSTEGDEAALQAALLELAAPAAIYRSSSCQCAPR